MDDVRDSTLDLLHVKRIGDIRYSDYLRRDMPWRRVSQECLAYLCSQFISQRRAWRQFHEEDNALFALEILADCEAVCNAGNRLDLVVYLGRPNPDSGRIER